MIIHPVTVYQRKIRGNLAKNYNKGTVIDYPGTTFSALLRIVDYSDQKADF